MLSRTSESERHSPGGNTGCSADSACFITEMSYHGLKKVRDKTRIGCAQCQNTVAIDICCYEKVSDQGPV